MDKYNIILEGLKGFYNVNNDLRQDLEQYSIEGTGRTLNQNIELFAKNNANNEYTDQIIEELEALNSAPHSISEMEIMYEFIDDFSLMEV